MATPALPMNTANIAAVTVVFKTAIDLPLGSPLPVIPQERADFNGFPFILLHRFAVTREQSRRDCTCERHRVDGGLTAAPGNVALQQISGFIELSRGSNNKKALGDIAGSLDSLDAASPLKQLTKILQGAPRAGPQRLQGVRRQARAAHQVQPDLLPRLAHSWSRPASGAAKSRNIIDAAPAWPHARRPSIRAPLATEVLVAAGKYDEALLMAQQWRRRPSPSPSMRTSASPPSTATRSDTTTHSSASSHGGRRILAEGDGFPPSTCSCWPTCSPMAASCKRPRTSCGRATERDATWRSAPWPSPKPCPLRCRNNG